MWASSTLDDMQAIEKSLDIELSVISQKLIT